MLIHGSVNHSILRWTEIRPVSATKVNLVTPVDSGNLDYTWGAIDMIPDTDFPDIRKISIIRSENGSCMIIPRENDMIRLYVQLSETDVEGAKMGPDKLLEVTYSYQKAIDLIFMSNFRWPGSRCTRIEWALQRPLIGGLYIPVRSHVTVESGSTIDPRIRTLVGQRLASEYSIKDRIFIAGDACHTHSPKAGEFQPLKIQLAC